VWRIIDGGSYIIKESYRLYDPEKLELPHENIRGENMQEPPYPLRLPGDLREWMEKRAAENHRSLNKELTHRLRESKEREDKAAQ
jgi:hypothetical protein